MVVKGILALFCLLILISCSAQNNENAIVGKWLSSEKNLMVEVYKQGADFKARVVWFYDAKDTITPINQRFDKRNPNKALRTQKLLGLDVLKHLVYNAKDNKWIDGKIYDSTSGNTWNATVWLVSDKLMKVRGYCYFMFLGKTLTFTKV